MPERKLCFEIEDRMWGYTGPVEARGLENSSALHKIIAAFTGQLLYPSNLDGEHGDFIDLNRNNGRQNPALDEPKWCYGNPPSIDTIPLPCLLSVVALTGACGECGDFRQWSSMYEGAWHIWGGGLDLGPQRDDIEIYNPTSMAPYFLDPITVFDTIFVEVDGEPARAPGPAKVPPLGLCPSPRFCDIDKTVISCKKNFKLREVPLGINRNAVSLTLVQTSISRLRAGAGLSNLTSLVTASFAYNIISVIEPGAFRDLYSLTRLDLTHNTPLTELSGRSFEGLVALETLHMAGTGLTKLPRGIWRDSKSTLTEFYFERSDHLRTLDEDFLSGLTALKLLQLDPRVRTFHPAAMVNLTALENFMTSPTSTSTDCSTISRFHPEFAGQDQEFYESYTTPAFPEKLFRNTLLLIWVLHARESAPCCPERSIDCISLNIWT